MAFAHFLSVFPPGPAVDWAHRKCTVVPGSPSLRLGNSTSTIHAASMVYTKGEHEDSCWSAVWGLVQFGCCLHEENRWAWEVALSRLLPSFACTLATDMSIKLYTSVDSRVVCNIKHRSYSHCQHFIQGKASVCQRFNSRMIFFVSK